MTFALYALLSPAAPTTAVDELARRVALHFADDPGFSLTFEQLPFFEGRSLVLGWSGWFARMAYEEGESIRHESCQIAEALGAGAAGGVSRIDRRIRVVFGDDNERKHTNEIIFVMDFLREIPGSILYDPQRGEIVE